GTIADARLSANVPLLNGTNLFSGTNRFSGVLVATNPANQLSGILGGNGSGISNLAAAQIVGTVPLAQLPSSLVTNGASGVNISGTFSCNGAGVTNISIGTLNAPGLFAWVGNFVLSSSPAVGSTPYSVVAADVNGDGKPDLICANNAGNTLSVLTNN